MPDPKAQGPLALATFGPLPAPKAHGIPRTAVGERCATLAPRVLLDSAAPPDTYSIVRAAPAIRRAVPPLSVVMPVYNAMPFLPAAIESILAQDLHDFELVIGDDASTDASRECIEQYARRDARIRVVHGRTRQGSAGASAWIADAARAPVVARMDADDVSVPSRLRREMWALAEHPSAVLVGSLYGAIDRDGRTLFGVDRSGMCGRVTPPIAHTSVMYRRDAFEAAGGYRTATDYFEDRDLYLRLLALGDILVFTEPLVWYRHSSAHDRLHGDRVAMERMLEASAASAALMARAAHRGPAEPQRNMRATGSGRLSPRVFRNLGALRVWAGGRPRVLTSMLTRMRLRPLRESLPALTWAACATVSPAAVRWASREARAWRDHRAGRSVHPDALYRWRPGQPAELIGPGDSR